MRFMASGILVLNDYCELSGNLGLAKKKYLNKYDGKKKGKILYLVR